MVLVCRKIVSYKSWFDHLHTLNASFFWNSSGILLSCWYGTSLTPCLSHLSCYRALYSTAGTTDIWLLTVLTPYWLLTDSLPLSLPYTHALPVKIPAVQYRSGDSWDRVSGDERWWPDPTPFHPFHPSTLGLLKPPTRLLSWSSKKSRINADASNTSIN